MTERDMQTLWGKYIQENPPQGSEAYELKFTKDGRIPFAAVAEHQIDGLVKASEDFLYHRITDQPWMPDRPWSFTIKKPFDCFVLKGVQAFVVVWFYKPRERKIFVKIPIQEWLRLMEIAERKSITFAMAQEIGELIIL